MVISSPSRSAAIGPPRAASGATWPAMKPCVAPEKRPSVISATLVAEALADERGGDGQHLAHARPTRGALVADHDDVAGGDRPAMTAAIAASSPSKTRAGPTWRRRSCPASLTTQPSGARLPRRIARPPVGLSGSASGRIDLLPGGLGRGAPMLGDRRARRRSTASPSGASFAAGACATQRHAAGVVEVGRDEAAARLQVARSAACARRSRRTRRSTARRPSSLATRQQVQHAVGRAAAGGDRGDRVLERLRA